MPIESNKIHTGLPISPSASSTEWDRAANDPEFKALMAAKLKFVIPATIFFMVYYLALPILVGYAPALMKTTVIGPINLAYLFALSQFFMTWIVAYFYMRAAGKFDLMAKTVINHLQLSKNEGPR